MRFHGNVLTAGDPRRARGERHPLAKTTAQDVREMRRLWDTGAATQAELAEQYGLDDSQVCRIVNRRIWKHVA